MKMTPIQFFEDAPLDRSRRLSIWIRNNKILISTVDNRMSSLTFAVQDVEQAAKILGALATAIVMIEEEGP